MEKKITRELLRWNHFCINHALKIQRFHYFQEADITRHVCWHSLSRLMGNHHSISQENRLVLSEQLISLHKKCSDTFQDYSNTVIRPYDSYLVLACHNLWELWHETSNDKYFWMAVFNLSKALKDSPASYNLRLLIIKFLNYSGAVGASQVFHADLELKHVQLDSMGYILTKHIQSSAHFHTAIGMFSSHLKFFNSNYKDVSPFVYCILESTWMNPKYSIRM